MGAKVIVTDIGNSRTDFANSQFVIQVAYFLTDGATFDQGIVQGPSNGTQINVSFGLTHKKADALIRQGIANYVFSVYGLNIDPDEDIYIPFAIR